MKANLIFYALVLLIGLNSCKKEEAVPPFYKANSCIGLLEKTVYVDSVIQFTNCSDSINVTYEWNFGDGTISSERAPMHSYDNHGNYIVTLKTFVNNVPADTSCLNVKVIIGERYFELLKITGGLDFAECSDRSILLLGATRNGEEYKVFISKFDKNLKQKWIKYLNTNLNPSFESIERLSDENFIISGSYDNTNNRGHFALSKVDTSGNVIWTNNYPQTNGYCTYATESKDGGIVAIGAENYLHTPSGNTVQIVSVLKTDARGKFVWKKLFVNDWLMDARNIISVNDGFIFASSTRGKGPFLNGHDSLVVMKIGFDSETIWKKSKEWQIPESHISYNVFSSSLAINNSNIIAINEGNEFAMIFDLQGNFIKRNYSNIGKNKFISKTKNDKFIIGGGDTYWSHIMLNGFNNEGDMNWSASYGKRNTNYAYSNGFGSKVKPLLDGNLLFLGLSYKKSMSYDESSILLVKINENGDVQ